MNKGFKVMKNFFLIIALSLTFSAQLNAATHEFSSIEEAKVNASARNKEILDQSQEPEELPSNDEEMVEYIQNRVEDLDITVLPDGDTFDKISSFSRVDDLPPEEKKSMWEKIYDGAMERISGAPGVNTDIRPVEYYTPKRDIDEEEQEEEGRRKEGRKKGRVLWGGVSKMKKQQQQQLFFFCCSMNKSNLLIVLNPEGIPIDGL